MLTSRASRIAGWVIASFGVWLVGTALGTPNPNPRPADGKTVTAPAADSVFSLTVKMMDGKVQPLAEYRGKVLLIVNTASECGYTSQLAGLEALHQKYKSRGLLVLGFPSDDFHQEPGSGTQIASFCRARYGVSFPLFDKGPVLGPAAGPLWKLLGQKQGAPKWNFFKYLVGKDGTVRAHYDSEVVPDDAKLRKALEAALAE